MPLAIAREFLKGAELALEKELYRVAAANAYYAMFWAAQGALRSLGVTRPGWSHGGLQHAFGLELIKKRGLLPQRMGEWMNEGYRLRCSAHYEEDEVSPKKTRRMVGHGAGFVSQIEEVVGSESGG